jgi:4,5-DOPA dioxygenase extradiol
MTTRLPAIFVNHGGGPMPLLGRQPELVANMQDIVQNHLSQPQYPKPKAIVLLSAHWESNPVRITSSPHPKMYYDYGGFPPESYKFNYPAPGSPDLAQRIQNLLSEVGIPSELDSKRGFDHGVFVPLMIMYPEVSVCVCVCVCVCVWVQIRIFVFR